MQAPKAKAKAKAKAKTKAQADTKGSAGARVDKCDWCGEKRQGWCDQSRAFYCEHCWTDYDTLQGGGEEYAGKVWHDEILEEDNIAAEDDDDGGVLEFMKNALNQIESDKKMSPSKDAFDESDDDCHEEIDAVSELPVAFSVAKKPAELELQQAHVVVIVDTSGSMRTNDVKPETGLDYVTRMAAVTTSLSTFFEKQLESGCPHKFSLISFSEESRVHFSASSAWAAALRARQNQSFGFVASRGTHFVEGLTAAKNVLAEASGTPHFLIFSDGRPADGRQMIQIAQTMLEEFPTLRIHAVGFGDSLDFELLQQLTSIGRGTFAPSARSVRALHSAFASVTSTITATQTVTSSSNGRKSSAYSFRGQPPQSSGEDAWHESKAKNVPLREVSFEPANQFVWNTTHCLTFKVRRRWYTFNGKDFEMHEKFADYKSNPVSIRLHPFTQGGMRLVYCFRDSTIPLFAEQRRDMFAMREAGTNARMVAKLSKYVDAWHNSCDIVSANAKCSAVARFYSRVFRLAVMDCLGWAGRKMARIIFLECYLYKAEEDSAPAPFMVGERFLPGVFRKYNGNNGYVNPDVPDFEVAQAFSHFTFQASRGKLMVLDLQGVHLDKAQRRKPHLILTDPQVVSVEKTYGPGDVGEQGMRAFFRSHRCGVTCKKLGLDQEAWAKTHRAARKSRKEPSSVSATSSIAAVAPFNSAATTASTAMVPMTWSTATTSDTSGKISDLRMPDSLPNEWAVPIKEPQRDEHPGCQPAAPASGHNKQPSEGNQMPLPELAMEARLMKPSPYPPNFGTKTGPLSALMARTAVETGRPDYDTLLQRRPTVTTPAVAEVPLTGENLQKKPGEGLVQSQAQKDSKFSIDTSGSLETASQGSLPSPQDSTGASAASSVRDAASGGETAAKAQSIPAQGDLKKSVVYGPGGKKLTLNVSCRGHVVAAIAAELSIPEEEQHLFQESSSQPNVDFYRVEHKMDPRKLRFTQSSISPSFRDGRPITDLLNDLNLQKVDSLRELEPLDVVWHEGFWRSLSNRRLWALKHCTLAFSEQPFFVRVRVRQPDGEFRTKNNSTNDGFSVLIGPRPRSPSPTAAKSAAV